MQRITVTPEELKKLVEDAVSSALKKNMEQAEKEEKKARYEKTYALMKEYRDMTAYLSQPLTETSEKTLMTKRRLDDVMKIVRKRLDEQGRRDEFTAFEMYFVKGHTYEAIAEHLNTGKNTPRRWVANVINAMTTLLYGLDDIN